MENLTRRLKVIITSRCPESDVQHAHILYSRCDGQVSTTHWLQMPKPLGTICGNGKIHKSKKGLPGKKIKFNRWVNESENVWTCPDCEGKSGHKLHSKF